MPGSFLWVILYSFTTLQGVFLSLLFAFDRRGRRIVNGTLAVLMLIIALLHMPFLLYAGGWAHHAIPHLALTEPLWYLLGPILFAYLWLLTGHLLPSWPMVGLHLLPFISKVAFVVHRIYFPDSFAQATYTEFLLEPMFGTTSRLQFADTVLLMSQLLVYALIGVRLLHRYAKSYQAQESYTSLDLLMWLRWITTCFAAYVVYETVLATYFMASDTLSMNYIYLSVLLLSSFLLLVAYTAIRYPSTLFPALATEQAPPQASSYQRSSLSDTFIANHVAQLELLMVQEQPYLKSNLKLSDLAVHLDISTHHLTQLLNQQLGKNFYDFVNTYRIEEAKRRLRDPGYAHLSILGIAMDVGFNSKTTFNRLFKKHTHMTPSQFKAQPYMVPPLP